MRTYGRVKNPDGSKRWVVVETDANGFDDYIWITTLCQVLLLNLGESPFYADHGLPAKQSIIQQIAPDFNIALTQQQFAQYFANLVIARVPGGPDTPPTYRANITTQQGVKVAVEIPT